MLRLQTSGFRGPNQAALMVPQPQPRQTCAMDLHTPPIKVFLADDSIPVRDRVASMLRDQHMAVVGQAHTPQASIDGILATRPDVVVLDIQLQGGSGLDVLRAVRLAAPQIAFVVLSNNSGPAYRKLFRMEGAGQFLDKSDDFGQLAHAVEEAVHPTANQMPSDD
jgi:DNA-binding NarL/FixJ family response regulator